MSAAANAAGYLYIHRLLPGTVQAEPKIVERRAAPQPDKQPRTPKIEYRKRRVCVMPAATEEAWTAANSAT
jgi:hypothetical protein